VRSFLLIYDSTTEGTVEKRIAPLFKDWGFASRAFNPADEEPFPEKTVILTWLGDGDLASLMPRVLAANLSLGLLPHPGLKQARLGFGIAAKLEDAVSDILSAETPVNVDLMQCNGRTVFNSVIFGDPFTITPGTAAVEPVWRRVKRLITVARNLPKEAPRDVKLVTSRENMVETAAIGLVAVEHGRSSAFSRRILSESAVNDGMLNVVVFSPRSVGQMLWFLFTAMFFMQRGMSKLPDFAGLIKSEAVTITSPKPMRYSVDGQPFTGKDLDLSVAKHALSLFPGRHLSLDAQAPSNKEVFRVKGLPTGEVRTALLSAPLPLIHHASTEEFKELFTLLKDNARTSESYVVLTVLSVLLATFGLFANSAPVIIGAMILAPLMAPIVSLSMGVLRQQHALAKESGQTLLLGIGLTLVCAMVLTWLTPLQTINSEIGARLSPNLLDLGVAVASGVAGAYAHARSEVARSLAGVAIAVALVPPLAVAGIGMGWFDWAVFYGAFLLFVTNLTGILLAAALTFLALGYSAFGRARRGVVASMVLVGLVSIPLALAFRSMVDEHNVIRDLDGWRAGEVLVRDVDIRTVRPLYISVRLIADTPIDKAQIDEVKALIEQRLGRELTLEATVAVVR